jgi:16S rRNA processing protein RimM
MSDDPVLLEVGRVGRAHGLRGEVHIVAVSNVPERFAAGSRLLVGDAALVVASAREAGNGWVVHFAGVDDRTTAESLRGRTVRASPLGDAPEGTLFVHDLIGAEVHDPSGATLGRVSAVQANPAHDLLVLDNGTLVPMVFVVDQQPGTVVVDVPDGLFDL